MPSADATVSLPSDAMGQMETHKLSRAALRYRSFVSIDPDFNTGF
jgi:hypothetical protein